MDIDKLILRLLESGQGNAVALSYIQRELRQPLLVAPDFVEGYVMSALRAPDVSALSTIHGEHEMDSVNSGFPLQKRGNTAILHINGGLVTRHEEGMCGATASYEGLRSVLDSLMNNDEIHNIVARFNTGGGSVGGFKYMADYIYGLRGQGKGLYAIADTVALSAGYGLISAFDEVWAGHGSALGNIGVYIRHQENSEQLKANGIKTTYMYAGKFKLMGASEIPLSEGDKERIQAGVNDEYVMFTEAVAKYRGMSLESVVNTEALWYNDITSVKMGLADRVGSFPELLDHIDGINPIRKASSQTSSGAHMSTAAQATEPSQEVIAKIEANLIARQEATAAQAAQAAELAQANKALADNKAIQDTMAERTSTITLLCNAGGITQPDQVSAFIASASTIEEVSADIAKLNTSDDTNLAGNMGAGTGGAQASAWDAVEWSK